MLTVRSLLLALLLLSALAVARTRDLLSAAVIFAGYSLIMATVWQQLRAPDIALAEAAIGAGITSLLFIVTVARTGRYEK
ncbi:MAG: multicomponent Na+:H+ antiporter subunit [Bacillota bacterium]|jgi:uncharacterized MnhB-related membrane protein|nr:multicomponent Na+:H+ antiporter subunit [Bacillota bacterium]MDK2926106.1 multicomponent Na+:H+ antiporter subunit [Bacillota bacterium]MDK2960083.1 multicomponent Na+:H+ antiporter subunit [Bacillota bacterium]